MNRWNVIILGVNVEDSALDDASRRVAAAWNGPRDLTFSLCGCEAPLPEEPMRFDAAIVVAREPVSESRVLRVLSAFEECSIPLLALVAGDIGPNNPFALAGALVVALNAADALLAAMLQALLHRQQEVRRLQAEISVAQRFQGGLNGQIAKMHDELRLAALVQRELLPPQLPQLHGVQIGALWRPVNYVSGDIYDVTRLDDDHVGIFLADAVGHGVPAALMTMVLCHALRLRGTKLDEPSLLPPGEVLTRLNASLIERQGGNTRFATAVYALLDCRRRVLTLAGAGHPPPIHLRADGSAAELTTDGGLLGIFPDERYSQVEIELAAGDRVLFFSDGFEQAFPNPDQKDRSAHLPTTRYRQEFASLCAINSAEAMVDALSHRLDSQRGSLHQADDLTLVCVLAGPLVTASSDAVDETIRIAA